MRKRKIKSTIKRAFTITELVIVIAVIAILAAVIVPSYAYITSGNKQTQDETYVSELNTALSSYINTNNGGAAPENYQQLMSAIAGAGYCTTANPYLISSSLNTNGACVVWFPGTTSVVLVLPDNYTVTAYTDSSSVISAACGNAVKLVDGADNVSYAVRLCCSGNEAEVAAATLYQLYYQAYGGNNFNLSDFKASADYSTAYSNLNSLDSAWATAIEKAIGQ